MATCCFLVVLLGLFSAASPVPIKAGVFFPGTLGWRWGYVTVRSIWYKYRISTRWTVIRKKVNRQSRMKTEREKPTNRLPKSSMVIRIDEENSAALRILMTIMQAGVAPHALLYATSWHKRLKFWSGGWVVEEWWTGGNTIGEYQVRSGLDRRKKGQIPRSACIRKTMNQNFGLRVRFLVRWMWGWSLWASEWSITYRYANGCSKEV